MDINKTIHILEALASGCSPVTGEQLGNETILNERDVIRALQMAIDILKGDDKKATHENIIAKDEIETVIELLTGNNISPTYSRLTAFFLAGRRFEIDALDSNSLYGKYKGKYKKGELLDYFTAYLLGNGYTKHGKKVSRSGDNSPEREIDFFDQEVFNTLSEKAIDQLKAKVHGFGVIKAENIAEHIVIARARYPRAYEPWTDAEKELLSKALYYTNDLDLLSACFQRGQGSVKSMGQTLIYEKLSNKGE